MSWRWNHLQDLIFNLDTLCFGTWSYIWSHIFKIQYIRNFNYESKKLYVFLLHNKIFNKDWLCCESLIAVEKVLGTNKSNVEE